MSQIPIITNALVLPGVSVSESGRLLLVGLVVDDRRIGWGECWFGSADSDDSLELNDGIHILQEIIIPALVGRPLSNVDALMEEIDGMGWEVTLTRPVTGETPPQRRSRRELFSSLLNPAEEIREVVERPLPPEIRLGVSEALLEAYAAVREEPVVAAVGRLFGLQRAESLPPVHLLFDDLPNPNDPALARISAASYGLVIDDGDFKKALGNNGIRFQNRTRQLKNRAVRSASDGRETAFLFDLKGGFGELYQYQSGSILGALFGLEQVTKPHTLRLVDPVIMESGREQIEEMKGLRDFVRLRKMKTRLIGRAWVETAEDVHAFADGGCCDGVLLDMGRLGTVGRCIALAGAARERGLEVVLAGARGGAAVQVALALDPALVVLGTADLPEVVNEMNRTLAWDTYNDYNLCTLFLSWLISGRFASVCQQLKLLFPGLLLLLNHFQDLTTCQRPLDLFPFGGPFRFLRYAVLPLVYQFGKQLLVSRQLLLHRLTILLPLRNRPNYCLYIFRSLLLH